MKKVLITGGAGFIGTNLALALMDKGYEVSVLDPLSPQIHGENPLVNSPLYLTIKDKVEFFHGDIRDKDLLTRALEGQHIVVHYAAETGTGQSMYEIMRYTDVNIGGTALMLELLSKNRGSVEKVIVASSRSIYGEGKYFSADLGRAVYPVQRAKTDMESGDFEVKFAGNNSPLALMATDEDSKIHPSSVYGITKQNQEQMILTVCPTIGIAPVAFRYQNVYGPGQSLSNPYTGILSIFSTLIRNGKNINVFEDGLESRDFVYIDDVVAATILGIESDAANGEVFNVGSGVNTSVIEVAETLVRLYKSKVEIAVSGAFRLGDIRHNYADLSKIRSKLGFEPKVTFEQGIERFVAWVLQQAQVESRYEESIREMRDKGLLG